MLIDMLKMTLSSPETAMIALSAVAASVWQAWGLATSRQWFLLPVAAGVLGLAAFLLNPTADSTALIDLQVSLIRGPGLLTLCTMQLTLSAASFWLGLRCAVDDAPERWRLMLGCLHVLPAVMVLVGTVFIEQQWLSQQVGARPEWVGIGVGSALATSLCLMTGLLAVLPLGWRSQGHLVCSLWVATLAALLTSIDCTLPQTGASSDAATTASQLGIGLGSAALIMAIGYGWERYSARTAGLRGRISGTAHPAISSSTSR